MGWRKEFIAGVAGADVLTALEALVVGGSVGYTASKAYDGFIQKYSSKGATATMNSGKTAMKDSDNHWYEVDEKGEYVRASIIFRMRLEKLKKN